MDRLRNILVATDLSPASRASLMQGARLAAASKAELHVVHVVRYEYAAELEQMIPDINPTVGEHIRNDARHALEAEFQALNIDNVSSSRVVVGNPIREILASIESKSADLLVIGATGASGRTGLGTTAVRCVRKAPTKVLIVPEGFSEPFKSVVACIDFSPLSPVVMQQATRVRGFDGGEVTAIHVYHMPWERSRWGSPSPNAGMLEKDFKDLLQRRFDVEIGKDFSDSGIRFELVKHAEFGEGIVQYAMDHEAQLVITGTTGRTALGYVLLGTTAEKVMRSVGCAVLAVKQPGAGVGPESSGDEVE